jgi:hypothetical protein
MNNSSAARHKRACLSQYAACSHPFLSLHIVDHLPSGWARSLDPKADESAFASLLRPFSIASAAADMHKGSATASKPPNPTSLGDASPTSRLPILTMHPGHTDVSHDPRGRSVQKVCRSMMTQDSPDRAIRRWAYLVRSDFHGLGACVVEIIQGEVLVDGMRLFAARQSPIPSPACLSD